MTPALRVVVVACLLALGGGGGPARATPAGEPAPRGPSAIDSLRVVTRTGTATNNDTDDAFELCYAPGQCLVLDNAEINDRELGRVDEIDFDVSPLDPADIVEITLKPVAGSGQDAWLPTCIAVLTDGDLRYCNDTMGGQYLGSDPGDLMQWTDADTTYRGCAGCYGSALTHGPLVGHTTATTSRIGVRAASALPVQVRYGLEADLADGVLSTSATPGVAEDFAATIDLGGLSPDTTYFYEVLVDGSAASAPGLSFRTAPPGPAAFEVAFGSCARESAFPFQPIFTTILQQHAPDLMLMIGDNHYANTTDPARLAFFYRNSRSVLPLAALLARTPTWAVWDDHDYTGNNTDGTAPDKERSLTAFERYWANASYGGAGADGIWSRFTWGDVEFFLLDDRYHRDPPGTPAGTMLGAAQLGWLLDGLSASTATFKVLVSGSQWTPGGSTDSWASYDDEREQILDHVMQEGIAGVVLVSGDVHRAEVRRLREASPDTYAVWEFTSSPLANTNSPCPTGPEPDTLVFCADSLPYFGLLRFDTTATPPAVSYEVRNALDTLLHTTSLTLDDLTLVSAGLFADGFEAGDVSAWSGASP